MKWILIILQILICCVQRYPSQYSYPNQYQYTHQYDDQLNNFGKQNQELMYQRPYQSLEYFRQNMNMYRTCGTDATQNNCNPQQNLPQAEESVLVVPYPVPVLIFPIDKDKTTITTRLLSNTPTPTKHIQTQSTQPNKPKHRLNIPFNKTQNKALTSSTTKVKNVTKTEENRPNTTASHPIKSIYTYKTLEASPTTVSKSFYDKLNYSMFNKRHPKRLIHRICPEFICKRSSDNLKRPTQKRFFNFISTSSYTYKYEPLYSRKSVKRPRKIDNINIRRKVKGKKGKWDPVDFSDIIKKLSLKNT